MTVSVWDDNEFQIFSDQVTITAILPAPKMLLITVTVQSRVDTLLSETHQRSTNETALVWPSVNRCFHAC